MVGWFLAVDEQHLFDGPFEEGEEDAGQAVPTAQVGHMWRP